MPTAGGGNPLTFIGETVDVHAVSRRADVVPGLVTLAARLLVQRRFNCAGAGIFGVATAPWNLSSPDSTLRAKSIYRECSTGAGFDTSRYLLLFPMSRLARG